MKRRELIRHLEAHGLRPSRGTTTSTTSSLARSAATSGFPSPDLGRAFQRTATRAASEAVRAQPVAKLMDMLFRNMAVLIEHPLLAAVPGAVFVALFAVSRKLLVLTAAAAWLAYLPYEYAMKLRLLCSGDCNIRLDLMVLYPVLLIVSVVGVAVSARALVR